jgi:hypothetical protein
MPLRHVPNTCAERERERSILNSHASRISPELIECEFRLRSVIEGIDKDKILIRFTHIDHADPQREFSLVLDVSGALYKGMLQYIIISIIMLIFRIQCRQQLLSCPTFRSC